MSLIVRGRNIGKLEILKSSSGVFFEVERFNLVRGKKKFRCVEVVRDKLFICKVVKIEKEIGLILLLYFKM